MELELITCHFLVRDITSCNLGRKMEMLPHFLSFMAIFIAVSLHMAFVNENFVHLFLPYLT